MLIVALVLAVIGLAALVTAVVTSNELIAWVCIGASALGVILLIIDAIRERQQRRVDTGASAAPVAADDSATEVIAGAALTDDELAADIADEDHPEEVVHDEPEFDTYSDDEAEYPQPAEEAALHTVTEDSAEDSGDTEKSQGS